MSHPVWSNQRAPEFGPMQAKQIRQKCPLTALVCHKNQNQNTVIFEVQLQNNLIHPTQPIKAFWLLTDPAFRGKVHDFEDFCWNDRNFTWRHSVSVKTKNPDVPKLHEQIIVFKFDHVPEHEIQIKVVKGRAVSMVKHNNTTYMINNIFIELDLSRLTSVVIQPWKWKNAGRELIKALKANVINMKTRKGESLALVT